MRSLFRGNIEKIANGLFKDLDTYIKILNKYGFDGHIKDFIAGDKDGFRQISAGLSSRRHMSWLKLLNECEIPVDLFVKGSEADLLFKDFDIRGEVRGSASSRSKYLNWYSGTKKAPHSDKRVYLLTQEFYGVDGDVWLKNLKVTIAFMTNAKYQQANTGANVTFLKSSQIAEEELLCEYEISSEKLI
jgi:hypothetical protein